MNRLAAVLLVILVALSALAADRWRTTTLDSDSENHDDGWFADLDSDGDDDLVVMDRTTGVLYWYESADGGWVRHILANIPGGSTLAGYWATYVGDLDGDGDCDVIASWRNGSVTNWYENDGSGSFTEHLVGTGDIGGYNYHGGPVLADLNGDGDVDIAVNGFTTFGYFPGNGDGTFGSGVNLADSIMTGGTQYAFLGVGDLDGDGDPDLIPSHRDAGLQLWFRNNGSGVFSQDTVGTDNGSYHTWVGDLDGDGDLDVVTYGQDVIELGWYENDGSADFTFHTIDSGIAAPNYNKGVFALDLDFDGDLDLVVAENDGSAALIYTNNGSESFTSASLDAGGPAGTFFAPADSVFTGILGLAYDAGWARVLHLEDATTRHVDGDYAIDLSDSTVYDGISGISKSNSIVHWTVAGDSLTGYSRGDIEWNVEQAGGAHEIRGSVLGYPCYAWRGDGASDYLKMISTHEDSVDYRDGIRYTALFRVETTGEQGYVFDKYTAAGGLKLYVDGGNDVIQATLAIDGSDSTLQVYWPDDTFWHLLTVGVTADTLAILLDGAVLQVEPITIADPVHAQNDSSLVLAADQSGGNLLKGELAFFDVGAGKFADASGTDGGISGYHQSLWAELYPVLYGDSAFAAIQPALDYCYTGDRVLVSPGRYTEPLHVDSTLKILGSTAAKVRLDGSGLPGGYSGVTVGAASSLTLSGLTVARMPEAGLAVEGEGAGVYLSEVVLAANRGAGVWFDHRTSGDSSGIDQCTFHGNPVAVDIQLNDQGAVGVANSIIASSDTIGLRNTALATGARLTNRFNLFSGNTVDTSGVTANEAMQSGTVRFVAPSRQDFRLMTFSKGVYQSDASTYQGALAPVAPPGRAWQQPQWGRLRYGSRKPTYLEPARFGR